MKVYLEPGPGLGRAIHRVAAALSRHAPGWVEVVPQRESAELEIIHALGAGEREPLIQRRILSQQMPYAMIQYTLRTSETPSARDWIGSWHDAALVWSYYDLPALLAEDFPNGYAPQAPPMPNFYHAPLGLDPAFTEIGGFGQRPFLIGTSGHIASTEGIDEWAEVCRRTKSQHFHLGPQLSPEMFYTGTARPLTDEQVASYWRACRYVAAMRRIEGFEFPGIEGLACGARPVCFDRPHYRRWYQEHAEYVPEGSPEEVVTALLDLGRKPYRAVAPSEQAWARVAFNWDAILGEFWARLDGAVR